MARKVVVLFVQGARKESGADCQWCCLSGPPSVRPERHIPILVRLGPAAAPGEHILKSFDFKICWARSVALGPCDIE